MRFAEFWITDHTDNSGFTVETKPNPKAFGSCNYHHVVSIDRVTELEEQIKRLQKKLRIGKPTIRNNPCPDRITRGHRGCEICDAHYGRKRC